MRLILITLLLLLAPLAFSEIVTTNGSYQMKVCNSGTGTVEVYPSDGGYDSALVTLQYLSPATRAWQTLCPIEDECQWSDGSSGLVHFRVTKGYSVKLEVTDVVTASDLRILLSCQ